MWGRRLESVSFELESIVVCLGEVNDILWLSVTKKGADIFIEIVLEEGFIDSYKEHPLIGQSFKPIYLCRLMEFL